MMALDDPQQLSNEDYQSLSAWGPTGLTEDQYLQIIQATEIIKGRAFAAGYRAHYEHQNARKELTRRDTNDQ